MNVGAFVTLKVLPGKNREFEESFAEQAANCRANETGQQLYKLFKSRTDPQTYFVMEIYDDAAALEFHRNAPHMGLTRPRVRATLDGAIGAEFLDAV